MNEDPLSSASLVEGEGPDQELTFAAVGNAETSTAASRDRTGRTADDLRAGEIAVYRLIAQSGASGADRRALAKAAEMTLDQFGYHLDRLVRAGLVYLDCTTKTYGVANPRSTGEMLIRALEADLLREQAALDMRRQDVTAIRRTFNELAETYHEAHRSHTDCGIQVLRSGTAVRALLERAISECREEVSACQPGGPRPPEVLANALPRDLAMLRRGVRLQSLYQHSSRFDGPTIEYAGKVVDAGAEIRTATTLPPRMILIDRRLVLLTHRSDDSAAVIVQEPSIVSYLGEVFRRAWEDASPYTAARTHNTTETWDATERLLLQLLGDGLTVAGIARRLGIAERTCQGYLNRVYNDLGVSDRFQAGVVAHARGLVDATRVTAARKVRDKSPSDRTPIA
ncbi:LuxR C-terminal-related transcriptional regulator [Streptomyces sp. ME03-5709C]|nr:LuxR C-terminal-related transcriptional regulator [Streptomyces sp. ME03-5709C]